MEKWDLLPPTKRCATVPALPCSLVSWLFPKTGALRLAARVPLDLQFTPVYSCFTASQWNV